MIVNGTEGTRNFDTLIDIMDYDSLVYNRFEIFEFED